MGNAEILIFNLQYYNLWDHIMIGVLRFQSKYTASTFRWPVKIPSNLPRNIGYHVLDYTVSKHRPHYNSSLP